MISQTARYALHAAVFLAEHPEGSWTTHQMAEALHLREQYLSKVLVALRRVGLVDSQRGTHGGYVLARLAETLTLFDVIQAIEPTDRWRGQVTAGGCGCARPLENHLNTVMDMVESCLRTTTLTDCLRDPTHQLIDGVPACLARLQSTPCAPSPPLPG